MRATLLLLSLLIAACASRAATPSEGPSPSSSASPAGVSVVLTGVPLVADDGGVEWCPGMHDGACAGIPVTGLPPDSVEPLRAADRPWQVEGRYDGRSVAAVGPPKPMERPSHDFSTPCEGLRGRPGAGGNPDLAAAEAVGRYAATIPDRYAGDWWDNESAVLTVVLTGDDIADHRSALEEAVGNRGTVCVVGGARYSLAKLRDVQEQVTDIATDAGLGLWSSSVDVVANRVDLEVEYADAPTQRRIGRQFGDAVRIRAYMALPDATLAQLPAPPSRGDVELETADTRGGGGMDALGHFTLRFDAERRCVYAEGTGERTRLIWPYGYYATSDPLRVFDQDGRLVAREGDQLRSGGGAAAGEGQEVCGTTDIWVMNGRPEVVGPSEG